MKKAPQNSIQNPKSSDTHSLESSRDNHHTPKNLKIRGKQKIEHGFFCTTATDRNSSYKLDIPYNQSNTFIDLARLIDSYLFDNNGRLKKERDKRIITHIFMQCLDLKSTKNIESFDSFCTGLLSIAKIKDRHRRRELYTPPMETLLEMMGFEPNQEKLDSSEILTVTLRNNPKERNVMDDNIQTEIDTDFTNATTVTITEGQRLRVKGGKLKRTQISLQPDIKQALDHLANQKDTSMSLLINQKLREDPEISQFIEQVEQITPSFTK